MKSNIYEYEVINYLSALNIIEYNDDRKRGYNLPSKKPILRRISEEERRAREWRRREERRQLAMQKRVEFLSFAGAVGLHPLHYADWLVKYLRGNGTASRTAEDFPYEEHDSSFETNNYWLLTNPDIMADDMPAGYGANRMHVFALEQPTFVRQLCRAVVSKLGTSAPKNAETEHSTGPFFQSGMENVYGQSSVHFLADAAIKQGRRWHPITIGMATRPNAVKVHHDIIPLAYEVAGDDPYVTRQLDIIVTNGSNRLPERQV